MFPTFALLFVTFLLYQLSRRSLRVSIARLRGPVSPSFLYGYIPTLVQDQAGAKDFQLQGTYGDVIRIRAPLGENRLLLMDPKALHHIFYNSGYRYSKPTGIRVILGAVLGPGLFYAEGEDHRRQRNIVLPGFGSRELRSFVPIFCSYASRMTAYWRSIIAADNSDSAVIEVTSWITRALLDATGEAAFDYQFGSLDNSETDLAKAYAHMALNVFGVPSKLALLVLCAMDSWLPESVSQFLTNIPVPRLNVARNVNTISTKVAKGLVDDKQALLLEGKSNKDIMSLLVKANASEDRKKKLPENELWAQMNTIIVAGHETTTNALAWTLLELARHPDVQTKLRTEVRAYLRKRAVSELTADDFDSMPYLTAVVKESLRFHPTLHHAYRYACEDDVLPLSQSIIDVDGKVLTEIPIPKGTYVFCSIAAYNRNKEIFGVDADLYNPERWLEGTVKPRNDTSIGVYANLFTFIGGKRSCTGWRFALLEMHAFVTELVNGFEFKLTADAHRIRREPCAVVTPTLEGEVDKGPQLKLKVKIAS
ncbi:cytochrome P450 [Guyanagaster necrorhizus]|uniref:Cytochrome P450 n=1 Tax=Guyanagaster necrorhizus TaxID=856835 RepID=A0A9P7VTK5_9AGAR|nr:cytochrome P450 [Guyanagaster necrorhizus MCA 3950]KAG7445691.1 cytochrome P450 [Guyanagaster necrorhizus MCA 3950]